MKVLLRVVLTLLLVVVGLKVGITLAPGLARIRTLDAPRPTRDARRQPDWGGGRLSFPARSAAEAIDSVRAAYGEDQSKAQTFAARAGGVALQQKAGGDYALTLALPSRDQPGRSGLFELPSSGHFKEQLFPEGLGTRSESLGGFRSCPAPPAADIPLYPHSTCRTQVGRGTACFVGFYLTPDSVEAVRSFYVRALSRLGWQRVTAGLERGHVPNCRTIRSCPLETFAKGNEDRMVIVQLRKQDSVTTRIGLVAMTSGMGK